MKPYKLTVQKYFNGWHVVLTIGNQSFHLESQDSRQAARWFKRMMTKALDRMIAEVKR